MTTQTAEQTTADAPLSRSEDAASSLPASGPEDLPLDVVFDLLKNRRRRLVIKYLEEESSTTTLSDLAEHIAALENDKTEEALTSAERKRVYVCLYQSHLPKMDDAGIIDFDSDRGTVEVDDDVDHFAEYIDVDGTDEGRDWPRYYLALSGIGAAAFVVQQTLLPSAALTGILIGVFLGLFVNLALEHAFQRGLLRPGVASVGDS